MAAKSKLDKRLTRSQAAHFLTEGGYIIESHTLANFALRGTGPEYCVLGRNAMYRKSDLLLWLRAQEKLKGALVSRKVGCANCHFFVASEIDRVFGDCRRNAPVPHDAVAMNLAVALLQDIRRAVETAPIERSALTEDFEDGVVSGTRHWPQVTEDDWCGEFKRPESTSG